MNYYECVQEIIDKLESSLKEKVEIEALIQNIFYSKTHFYRIFNAMVGVSVAEYIRKRRLSCAVNEICMTNRRILDIALDYGFASQEVFTRACQREYELTPGKLRHHLEGIVLYPKIKVRDEIEKRKDLLKDYRTEIVVSSGYTLYGFDVAVRPGSNSIKQLWAEFMEHRDRIITSNPNLVIGVCEFAPNATEEDEFRYFCGTQGKEKDSLVIKEKDSFIEKRITAGKYVKLYYEPEKRSLKETYKLFYGTWLPISEYQLEPKDTIEIYHLQKDGMEICIPIK